MAKKIGSKKEMGECTMEYSPRLHIDFDDVAEVKGVTLGDEIRVIVKGKVKSVEQRVSYDDNKTPVASICLEDFEAEIVPAGKFDSLLEDEDD